MSDRWVMTNGRMRRARAAKRFWAGFVLFVGVAAGATIGPLALGHEGRDWTDATLVGFAVTWYVAVGWMCGYQQAIAAMHCTDVEQ